MACPVPCHNRGSIVEYVLHETSDDGSGKRHKKNADLVTEAGWHLKQNTLHKEWRQSRETGRDKRFRLKQSVASHLFLCLSFEYKLHNVFFNKKEIKVSTEAVIGNR